MNVDQIFNYLSTLRWDIIITLLGSIICYFILLKIRIKRNKNLKNEEKPKQEIILFSDFLFTIGTTSTIYGGLTAIYFSITGKLLFNQNFVISQEWIIFFAGVVLIALGAITFRKAIKEIKEGNEEK